MKNKIAIPFEHKTAVLEFRDFDSDIDVDDLLRIDSSNIVGEVLTIAAFVNQIGLLRAEHEGKVKEARLEHQIYRAQLQERFRKEFHAKYEKVTVQQLDNAIIQDPGVQIQERNLIRYEKEFAYLDVLYDAVKRKDMKLNGFSKNLTPADMQNSLVESVVNNILITIKKNAF